MSINSVGDDDGGTGHNKRSTALLRSVSALGGTPALRLIGSFVRTLTKLKCCGRGTSFAGSANARVTSDDQSATFFGSDTDEVLNSAAQRFILVNNMLVIYVHAVVQLLEIQKEHIHIDVMEIIHTYSLF
jgi:hypothetical protein